jgi:hypothetical protein
MDNSIDKGFASVILTDTDLASKENEADTRLSDGGWVRAIRRIGF